MNRFRPRLPVATRLVMGVVVFGLVAWAAVAAGGGEAPAASSSRNPGTGSGSEGESPETVLVPAPPPAGSDLVPGGVTPRPDFTTDFARSVIPEAEIISGGPPKDGIPAIDDPHFAPVSEIDWLSDDEPIFLVQADGVARIYPLQILTYHEIVNDTVGTTPVSVTYCPLCNTGIAFRREFDDLVLDFGTTGRLRYSNLLMYDRQTETWWQQATGEGVIGRYAGERLDLYPLLMLPWDRAAERFPEASVLTRDTGHRRSYGTNPYAGYDTLTQPFLYRGPAVGEQFDPMARVIQVVVEGESFAVAYPVLEEQRIVQREVAGVPVVVLWEPGTASGLDAREIRSGRDVGSANAYRASLDGRPLTFRVGRGGFTDDETGSVWDATGLAVSGELAGARLEPIVGIQHFWFSYSAFETDGLFDPPGGR